MRPKVFITLPDGRQISLFAAKCLYRKTQFHIAFKKFTHLLCLLCCIGYYAFIRFKMFAQGRDVPHYLSWSGANQQMILNYFKVLFGIGNKRVHVAESESQIKVPRSLQVAMFVVLLISLVLNLIVAVGNWNLYARVERVETILGLRATPQSQRIPSR